MKFGGSSWVEYMRRQLFIPDFTAIPLFDLHELVEAYLACWRSELVGMHGLIQFQIIMMAISPKPHFQAFLHVHGRIEFYLEAIRAKEQKGPTNCSLDGQAFAFTERRCNSCTHGVRIATHNEMRYDTGRYHRHQVRSLAPEVPNFHWCHCGFVPEVAACPERHD